MIKRLRYLVFLVCTIKISMAQCPQIYDYLGNLSSHPYFVSCTGSSSYMVNFSSNSSWGTYTINWGDGSPNTAGASYTSPAIINHTYNSATPDTFLITLVIPSLSCTLTGVAVMEKPVNASIQIPVGGVTTACAPKVLAFTNSSTDVSKTTQFTWNFGDGTPPVAFSYTNAGQTVTHLYNRGTVNCQTQVTLTAKNYCTPVPTIANFNPIQIYDLDNAAITPSAFVKCWPDNSFTFNNTTNRNCVPQGNTFQRQEKWNFGNYWGMGHDSIINWRPWPPTSPHTVAYPAVGNYSVMLIDSNLCGVDTTVISVTIVNPPTAGVVAPGPPICQGSAATFTNTSSTGYIYKWNFGDGGGFVTRPYAPQSHTYALPGTYTVQLVALIAGAGPSCTDTAKVVINVLPRPTASFSVAPNKGCNSLSGVVFTDNSTSAALWAWNFGNGNTFVGQVPPAQNYSSVGNYVATLTVTALNSCTNTFTAPVNVYQTPTAAFSPSISACVGAPVTFADQSTHATGDPILNWTWNFGDATPPSTASSPTHSYSAQNTYTVKLVVATANCKDSVSHTVNVNVKPTASFTYSPASGCPPLAVTFTNTSANATSYSWHFGNGSVSTATNPAQTYTNSTASNKVYTVTLVAMTGFGCSDSIKKQVTVFPKPVSSFSVTGLAGCSPVPVTFTNTSVGANSYNWSFGDSGTSGSSAATVTHTYVNNTLLLQTYTVQLVATSANGCKDTSWHTVSAYPKPIFNFTMVPSSGCSPLNVNFPPVLGAVSYTWNFGDGTPVAMVANPSHTFTNTTTSSETFTVQLIAANAFSCQDTTYGYPVVFPKPVPSFTFSPTSGCSPLTINFTNTTVLGNTYAWQFGDGHTSTQTNPVNTYTNSSNTTNQSFACQLVAITSNGCRDSVTQPVTVSYRPKAAFSVDTPACSPKTLTFTNTSQGAVSYYWDFGNTSTSTFTNVTQQYINTSAVNHTYTVELIATSANNCRDTLFVPIVVHPKPSYTITALPDTGCTPLKVVFPSIAGVASYQWSFGDGSGGTSAPATNTYFNTTPTDKTYTVQLVGTDVYGCKDTATKRIYVYSRPVAFFQVNPTTVFIPTTPINCNNLSSGAVSYYWNFGDGGTSTVTNPSYTYQQQGDYQIYLVATNAHGCKDTFNLPSKIVAQLESDVQVPNAFTPNPTSGNGGTYSPTDLSNDVFHPVLRGIDKYELDIFSRWGELLFVSKDVNIGWDGYYRGRLCTQDVYIWKITATTIDGRKLTKAGDVLLLR